MNNQEGQGREQGKLRPSVIKLLNQVGNEPITSLTIWRRILPYSNFVKFLSPNVAPDKLYHTSLNINNKYNLEKDGITIKFERGKTEGETLSVPTASNMTIKELFDLTKRRMGKTFTEYTIDQYNCQNFVDNILSAIGSNSSEAKKFVNQDVKKVVDSLGGKFARVVAGVFKNIQEEVDIAQEGGGCVMYGSGYMYNNQLPRCKIQI